MSTMGMLCQFGEAIGMRCIRFLYFLYFNGASCLPPSE
jgi:hypothetical protein